MGNIFEVVYGPVILGATLLALGWITRLIWNDRRQRRVQFATLVTRVESLAHSDDDIRRDVERNNLFREREFPPVKEGLAILASEFERHERWHERHT